MKRLGQLLIFTGEAELPSVPRHENTRRPKQLVLFTGDAVIKNYLASHPCVDCGITEIDVLEFDHVRGKKLFNIRSGVHSFTETQEEIAKCEVRCANCHVRKTRREGDIAAGMHRASAAGTKLGRPLGNRAATWDRVCELARSGRSVSSLSREFGIARSTVRAWLKHGEISRLGQGSL